MANRKQPLPKLTAVTAEQATEINRIHFKYSYNFGPPPNPVSKTTLAEFIRDQEAGSPYAALDLVDKLKLDSFGPEWLDRHIDRNIARDARALECSYGGETDPILFADSGERSGNGQVAANR